MQGALRSEGQAPAVQASPFRGAVAPALVAWALLAAVEGWAAPAFVQQASGTGPPASVSVTLAAGNTVVVVIRGPTSFFPVTVSDTVGSSFVLSGTPLNGSGALTGTTAQLGYARVTTGGPRTISVSGSGSSNGVVVRALEFSGVTPNYYSFAYYTATGGPADGRSVSAAIDGLVFAHVLASGAVLDGGANFSALVSTGTEYVGWLAVAADGDYPLVVPVNGAWMSSLMSLASRLVVPDAGSDAGQDSGVPSADAGTQDGGTDDAGASADAGEPGDGGPGPDGGAGGGGPDGGSGAALARNLQVGCGCAGVPVPAALALLATARWASRRRRRG